VDVTLNPVGIVLRSTYTWDVFRTRGNVS